MKTPKRAVEELVRVREPGIFIVDDVAFIQAEHGMQLGEAIARRGIRKRYYLETRGDVLLRNKEIFQLWKRLGLNTMFIGLEAIDEDGLKRYRKLVTLSKNFEALEFARSLDISVAVNIIADPAWDRERFKVVRDWCLEIPEVVNISINTPYPGTETWRTESRRLTTRDYRLFDIQHAVLPTKLPLPESYKELVDTQRVLSHKPLGWAALRDCARIVARQLLRGQTTFIRMLWKFDSAYHPKLQLAKHSDALDLESDVFKGKDSHRIALSLKRSAQRSKRRKGTPYQSAMSMLNFYINRAGKNLPQSRKRVLERAKDELRDVFGRK